MPAGQGAKLLQLCLTFGEPFKIAVFQDVSPSRFMTQGAGRRFQKMVRPVKRKGLF